MLGNASISFLKYWSMQVLTSHKMLYKGSISFLKKSWTRQEKIVFAFQKDEKTSSSFSKMLRNANISFSKCLSM